MRSTRKMIVVNKIWLSSEVVSVRSKKKEKRERHERRKGKKAKGKKK